MVVVAATSCGSRLPAASAGAAERFYHAIELHDGAAACELLAPQTVHEVEQSEQAKCASAILDEDIPAGGAVVEARQYGTEAQARTGRDTAFLAEFDDGWKVVAAACTEQGQLPYDCKVKG
ncbi:hypothetical protein ACIA58_28720 [Kribbella sp. NPDC051586]|uniref:hypothetical protein n=1 Tax=Kribbella sp. NPDC051586 TaxID=3364118 RepID=UPI0037BB5035